LRLTRRPQQTAKSCQPACRRQAQLLFINQFCITNPTLQQTNSEKPNPNATQLDRIEDAVGFELLVSFCYLIT